jgi:hypothetical protein
LLARDGLFEALAFGQFQIPDPGVSPIQWSQSYTPRAACQWVFFLVPEAFCRKGPT